MNDELLKLAIELGIDVKHIEKEIKPMNVSVFVGKAGNDRVKAG